MAEVEDHTLAAHRLEQLPAELRQPARRPGAAAVSRRAPGGPDDAHAAVGPHAELRRIFHGGGPLHQQHGGDASLSPPADLRLEPCLSGYQLEAAALVVVDLGR